MIDLASGRLGRHGRGNRPHPRARWAWAAASAPGSARLSAPGLLVLAHLDTVHPIGTLAQLPFRRDGERNATALASAT